MDAYRFGGHRICYNKQVRTDLLEAAVWADVCSLLSEPERVEREYQRRLMNKKKSGRSHTAESLAASIKRVKRGIARLIDAYEDGLVDRGEFEPRVKRAKDRLAKLEAEAKVHAERATEEQQLRLVIGRLEEFAESVKGGLNETDWLTRRQIIRALVKRVEIDQESVRVVYRVAPPEQLCNIVGGVVSPILANVFLHYVLDEWFARQVQPRLPGRAFLIRYADDFVIGFTREDDARRVMEVLPKRLGKYGMTIHPDKTRLVWFQRPPHAHLPTGSPRCERPGTFDLLGFTHFWSRSRKGNWVVKRKTSASRFTRAVRTTSLWCRRHRHNPIEQQHRTLCQKLRGHNAYYGITGNSPSRWRFREEVRRLWRKWLYRRKRGRGPGWSWFYRLLERHPLPNPVTYHSVYHREAKV